MKQKYAFVLAACTTMLAYTLNVQAQKQPLPKQTQEHILVTAEGNRDLKSETLSGINLYPAAKGTFELNFSQELEENAMLEIKNRAGQTVYSKPVSIANNRTSWRYNVGKLRPDVYLIEVKTSDTTYWTKFKIGK